MINDIIPKFVKNPDDYTKFISSYVAKTNNKKLLQTNLKHLFDYQITIDHGVLKVYTDHTDNNVIEIVSEKELNMDELDELHYNLLKLNLSVKYFITEIFEEQTDQRIFEIRASNVKEDIVLQENFINDFEHKHNKHIIYIIRTYSLEDSYKIKNFLINEIQLKKHLSVFKPSFWTFHNILVLFLTSIIIYLLIYYLVNKKLPFTINFE